MVDTGVLSGFAAGLSIGLGLTFLLRKKGDSDKKEKNDPSKKQEGLEADDDEGDWEDDDSETDDGKKNYFSIVQYLNLSFSFVTYASDFKT